MTHTINHDKTAVVATDIYYQPMSSCPVGVKCLLLNPGGVAVISQYNGRDQGWQGWSPLPKRRQSDKPPKEILIQHKELH